jgi:hypothetical protein
LAITVTHITIPLDIDSRADKYTATCYVKLSNDSDAKTNVPICLVLLNADYEGGGGGNFIFFHGQNIPHGVNTLSLPIPWMYLYKLRDGGKFYLYLYQNAGEEPSEYQIGFEGETLYSEGEIPEFTYE